MGQKFYLFAARNDAHTSPLAVELPAASKEDKSMAVVNVPGWIGSSAVDVTGKRWMTEARVALRLPAAGWMSEMAGKSVHIGSFTINMNTQGARFIGWKIATNSNLYDYANGALGSFSGNRENCVGIGAEPFTDNNCHLGMSAHMGAKLRAVFSTGHTYEFTYSRTQGGVWGYYVTVGNNAFRDWVKANANKNITVTIYQI